METCSTPESHVLIPLLKTCAVYSSLLYVTYLHFSDDCICIIMHRYIYPYVHMSIVRFVYLSYLISSYLICSYLIYLSIYLSIYPISMFLSLFLPSFLSRLVLSHLILFHSIKSIQHDLRHLIFSICLSAQLPSYLPIFGKEALIKYYLSYLPGNVDLEEARSRLTTICCNAARRERWMWWLWVRVPGFGFVRNTPKKIRIATLQMWDYPVWLGYFRCI